MWLLLLVVVVVVVVVVAGVAVVVVVAVTAVVFEVPDNKYRHGPPIQPPPRPGECPTQTEWARRGEGGEV